jgi:hypothetical protein
MSATTEKDLRTMTEAELLALPSHELFGGLSRLWAIRTNALHERDVNELALELAGDTSRHLMISPDKDPKEKLRREEEEHRRAWLAYAESMREIRERSDRLLAQIEIRQQEIEQRRKEIEDNALRLHDGRRVYVDGDRYRDEQGRVLEGRDHDEAAALYRDKPDASTWRDKQEIDRQAEEMKRLRQKVLDQGAEIEKGGQGLSPEEWERRQKEADQKMTGYEKEFNDKFETTRADLAAKPQAALTAVYSADYGDLYGGSTDTSRTTSYAKTQDGGGSTLAASFTPAAEGQVGPEKQKTPQPPGPMWPKVQV